MNCFPRKFLIGKCQFRLFLNILSTKSLYILNEIVKIILKMNFPFKMVSYSAVSEMLNYNFCKRTFQLPLSFFYVQTELYLFFLLYTKDCIKCVRVL